jgi:uroporphyrinogen-III decarboxylase
MQTGEIERLEFTLEREKLSELCAAQDNAMSAEESLFSWLGDDYITEARALGAEIRETKSGYYNITPLFSNAEELSGLPDLSETSYIVSLTEAIKSRSADYPVALSINAPFTILAQICPQKLYAWLMRHGELVNGALEQLTNGLAKTVIAALSSGAALISVADPLASADMLGEKRFREFAAKYQYRFLKRISASLSEQSTLNNAVKRSRNEIHGVIHLCPYGFMRLEEYGLARYAENTVPCGLYEIALLELSRKPGIHFVSKQCPHTKYADRVFELEL